MNKAAETLPASWMLVPPWGLCPELVRASPVLVGRVCVLDDDGLDRSHLALCAHIAHAGAYPLPDCWFQKGLLPK